MVSMLLAPSDAQADGYDPAVLCPSATMSQVQLAASVETIDHQTPTAMSTAGGMTVNRNGHDQDITAEIDPANVREGLMSSQPT